MKVIIAGAGVAGLEAMLALGDLADGRVETELLSPTREFVYRPMLVAEPFGTARALRIDIEPLIAEAGARHIGDTLAGVDLKERYALTGSGERLDYDALLIALGAGPRTAVPGALTFDGTANHEIAQMLKTLGRRSLRRIAFVVPPQPTWTLAAYELALMTAAEREQRRIPELEVSVVTSERVPLEQFGSAASQLVRENLQAAGVGLVTSASARRFVEGRLELDGSDADLAFDQVVALPALSVPEISGLPQRPNGFVATDVAMHVGGLESVWAAGDATAFPVKNGGIAAQQADVAAQAIAVRAGAKVAIEPFHPILRGALITGGTPDFFEADLQSPDAGVARSGVPLWTPSIKLAAKYLGPCISRALRADSSAGGLAGVDPGAVPSDSSGDAQRAVDAAMAAADEDAARGDFEGALRWMSLIEQLDIAIPASCVVRREAWRRELNPSAHPHPAAGRMDPSFATAADAMNDLRRRIGWLREAEVGKGGEMAERLKRLEAGYDDVVQLSRKSGILKD